jgi:DNA-binding transcriptional regulator YiaG
MSTATLTGWKPGMDLPYVVEFGEGEMLAIQLKSDWLKPDRSGRPLLLPEAVRVVDRLRAVFANQEKITPGFIISLREAMGCTQEEFGEKLGVSKMTVSRWENRRMRPSPGAVAALRRLQNQAREAGVKISGKKGLRE